MSDRSSEARPPRPAVTPALDGVDLSCIAGLSVGWAMVGWLLLGSVDRGSMLGVLQSLSGGLALGVGCAGAVIWWRRRADPALALEAQAWALLAAVLPLAFLGGLLDPGVGQLVLATGSLSALLLSLRAGWRLTALIAAGRFGALAALGFSVWLVLGSLAP